MFYTPSPRKFHYTPRFYDPEKEEWNKMKERYGIDGKAPVTSKGLEADEARADEAERTAAKDEMAKEIAYFEARERELERKEKARAAKFGWKDLVRKREMPTFNYKPRFQEGGSLADPVKNELELGKKKKRISRRFDIEDTKYFEPIPAGKIMLYALGATLLLAWIFLF